MKLMTTLIKVRLTEKMATFALEWIRKHEHE